VVRPVEHLIYRIAGSRADDEMDWKTYAIAMLVFNALGMLAVYALQRLQYWLPLNPQGFDGVAPDCALNTAASFASNTNWQSYGGESTMSYFLQMAGLAVQNFASAATGIVLAIALIRGFARNSARALGMLPRSAARRTSARRRPMA
jgi:K+-transporting ATPase ATPase A chain